MQDYGDKHRACLLVYAPEKVSEKQWTLENLTATRVDRVDLAVEQADAHTWHRRLGHPGKTRFEKVISTNDEIAHLRGQSAWETIKGCYGCAVGKAHREHFPNAATRATEPGEIIHTDSFGPAPVATYGGHRYFVSFTDDYSRYSVIALLKNHSASAVFEEFVKFKAKFETMVGKRIIKVRSDNGKEYLGPFTRGLEIWGIEPQKTTIYTPQQNGVSERLNRTLLDTVRALFHDDNGPVDKQLWGEAILTANYLKNILPSRALLGMKAPYEILSGKKPNLGRLRVWGSPVTAHIPKQKVKDKLEKRGIRGIFVGYEESRKGWRVAYKKDDGEMDVIVSRDVDFRLEKGFTGDYVQVEALDSDQVGDTWNHPGQVTDPQTERDMFDRLRDLVPRQSTSTEPEPTESPILPENPTPAVRTPASKPVAPTTTNITPAVSSTLSRPRRGAQDPDRQASRERWKHQEAADLTYASLAMEEAAGLATTSIHGEPKTFVESQTRGDAQKWKEAVDAEWVSLVKNDTFEIVAKPEWLKEKDIITSRWVFKIKFDSKGDIERYKARLVARGYTQIEGINFEETFAPVAKMESIRIVLAISAEEDLLLDHVDMVTAYLNAILKQALYMYPPRDGPVGAIPAGMVLKVRRGLYGLKQSGMEWYELADETFSVKYGFSKLDTDHSVYVRYGPDDTKIYIAMYVDDLILASNSRPELDKFKRQLAEDFEMRDLGDLRWFLSVRVIRNREFGTISIDQSQYFQKLLEEYNYVDCKGISTPMEAGLSLMPYEGECQSNDKKVYQRLTGSFIYGMIGTRPDIAYAVSALSRFCSNPSKQHLAYLFRILRYIKQTINFGIVYGRKRGIYGYSDSAYAIDKSKGRSSTGYAIMMHGGVVAYKSRLQQTVALSSTEAEYMAMAEVTKEVLWVLQLLEGLGIAVTTFGKYKNSDGGMTIFGDNEAALLLAKTTKHHDRTKHINIRYHFLREHVKAGRIVFTHVRTELMWADTLTKPLGTAKFELCRDGLGMEEIKG